MGPERLNEINELILNLMSIRSRAITSRYFQNDTYHTKLMKDKYIQPMMVQKENTCCRTQMNMKQVLQESPPRLKHISPTSQSYRRIHHFTGLLPNGSPPPFPDSAFGPPAESGDPLILTTARVKQILVNPPQASRVGEKVNHLELHSYPQTKC